MKLVLIALNRALGRQVTMAEFRELLAAAHSDLITAAAADIGEGEPAAVDEGRYQEPRADAGQPLPGGQRLFETPGRSRAAQERARTGEEVEPELGTCPQCGSAIIEAATATSPPVCLACGPLTIPPL